MSFLVYRNRIQHKSAGVPLVPPELGMEAKRLKRLVQWARLLKRRSSSSRNIHLQRMKDLIDIASPEKPPPINWTDTPDVLSITDECDVLNVIPKADAHADDAWLQDLVDSLGDTAGPDLKRRHTLSLNLEPCTESL